MPEEKSNVTQADYEFLCDLEEAVGTVVEDDEKAEEAAYQVGKMLDERGLWPSFEGNSPVSG